MNQGGTETTVTTSAPLIVSRPVTLTMGIVRGDVGTATRQNHGGLGISVTSHYVSLLLDFCILNQTWSYSLLALFYRFIVYVHYNYTYLYVVKT